MSYFRCIKGELEGKTRILATHQIQFLNKVDKIIVMKEVSEKRC